MVDPGALPGVRKPKVFSTYTLTFIWMFIFATLEGSVTARHVQGEWNTGHFYQFLGKFGFQSARPDDIQGSSGYIYGNITLHGRDLIQSDYKFVAASGRYWDNYIGQYENRNKFNTTERTCSAMFECIDDVAYDKTCLPNGTLDLTRTIPCPANQLCADDLDRERLVIPGYQFTIQIGDTTGPSLWYLSMVSCYNKHTREDQDLTCSWHHGKKGEKIAYDLWLVNGNPLEKQNLFYFQFSYTLQGLLAMYLAFTVLYMPLLAGHTLAHSKYMHPIIKLYTLCLYTEFVGIVLLLIHLIMYSQDGVGLGVVFQFGNACDNISHCLFMLLLLLLAKGWTITTTKFTQRKLLFSVWGLYCITYATLFVWMAVGVDEMSNLNEYQTWPGAVILTLRCLIFIWFLVELKATCRQEYVMEKLRFYRWFGIGFSIWFVYLPLTVAICSFISPLWRQKTVSGMTLTADYISYLVLTMLFWPYWSSAYFKLGTSGSENKALLDEYSHLIEPI